MHTCQYSAPRKSRSAGVWDHPPLAPDTDGPGIPPDRRESVFRPFESGAGGGTGLGLTIARDIVRAHGGEIVLESSPMGGLRARVRLPMLPVPETV